MQAGTNKLSKSQFLQISIMLFGLFFGAGNLIFPPLLGNKAASSTLPALLGFLLTAVIFPVLGVIVVGRTSGLQKLAEQVGPRFALLFTTAIYLAIGPGLGIPRAGSVPFELAVLPYLPKEANMLIARLLYTFVFFALALIISLNPQKLVARIGKYLSPLLLLLILVMFIRNLALPLHIATPQKAYQNQALVQGFIDGYMTMDAVAALNFGFVISLAIRRFGIKDTAKVASYTSLAGFLAGTVLLVVYAMLAIIGVYSSSLVSNAQNGAEILARIVELGFGRNGLMLLALIFTLACLTTCVGLITSGAEYFCELFNKRLSYRTWVFIWTTFSFLVANFGLNNLLAFSIPLLIAIYPVALTLIVLGSLQKWLNFTRLTYVLAATFSVLIPLVYVLRNMFHISLPVLTSLETSLPLSSQGLSFVVPTLLAVVVSYLGSLLHAFVQLKLSQKATR